MDLNQSIDFTPEMQDFMPIGSFGLPDQYRNHASAKEKENMELFWNQQLFEIQNTTLEKPHHQFPLARVKRIMKAAGEVKMISSETPILFSKACEMFIMELTLRAWFHTEGSKRRTLQRCDIARAIAHDELLEFLIHAVRFDRDHFHKEGAIERTISRDAESESTGVVRFHRMNQELINDSGEVNQIGQQYMMDRSMSSDQLQRNFY